MESVCAIGMDLGEINADKTFKYVNTHVVLLFLWCVMVHTLYTLVMWYMLCRRCSSSGVGVALWPIPFNFYCSCIPHKEVRNEL